jgi:hypothetical protein
MLKHDHDKCRKLATTTDTIVSILSSWYFNFLRRDALQIESKPVDSGKNLVELLLHRFHRLTQNGKEVSHA